MPLFTKDLDASFSVAIGSGAQALTVDDVVIFKIKQALTLTGLELATLGGTGSLVADIWADTYGNLNPTVADTITASAKPTISSGIKYQDNSLTGWTKTLPAGTFLYIKFDSISTFKQVSFNFSAVKNG